MKKILYVVAFATFALVSCHDKNAPENQKESNVLTFKASIEALATDANAGNRSAESASAGMAKATIDSSNDLVWAENDQIGVYFPTWGEKNQSFTLVDGDAGSKSGSFVRDQSGDYNPSDATVAFFPWLGDNNVYEGTMYFTLKNWYDDYTTSGKMLTPLIASISSSSEISFKHAGAAVKLTINNLVSGGYKTKMSVAGKQITGAFHINPANAGTDALILNDAEDVSKNYVTLNSWKGSGAFSWIFPVPALTAPELTFEIVDGNGVTVWSKSPKFAQKNVGRAQLLVMPALDITPYSTFSEDNTTWTFSGNINGSEWYDDVPMMTDGNYSILSGCSFVAGDKFRIRKNNSWDEAYPEGVGNNWVFTSENAGTKDIIFNCSTHEISVVTHNFPYPPVDLSYLASSITIDGNMSDWTGITSLASTGTSRIRSWKFYSDGTNLYFYLVLRKNRMNNGNQLSLAFKWDNEGTRDVDNLKNANCILKFQPFTNSDNDSGSKPTCVNGSISTATVNGTSTSVTINAWGYNPNTSVNGDSDDYYLEFSIPRSDIPSLPAVGTGINIGAGYDYYNTSYQSVTL